MTTLRQEKQTLYASPLNGENPLPPVSGVCNVQQPRRARLDDDDGLYLGYGFASGSFPYRQQDQYGEAMKETAVDVLTLENDYLRAEFLPAFGGRLRSLFDKEHGCELLYKNPVLRPRNLAVRNAWMAGGVEWNCGVVGHSPLTCAPVFAAPLSLPDGTPGLRLYAFERIRAVPYQMDFFLPAESRFLYVRVRIENPSTETIPMYWWSNIAVREEKGARVIVPADQAYTNHQGAVYKVSVPISDGVDITYPENSPSAVDYFWRLRAGARPFIYCPGQSGYGLVQCSTERLKGRKLFVWGQTPGSEHWKRFLTDEPCDGRYIEIQAGLAKTQYECLPMPPETAWEWLEAYGPMRIDGKRVSGAWDDAVQSAVEALDQALPMEKLDALLCQTRPMAKSPAGTPIFSGDGWGALEVLRRAAQGERMMAPQLDFGNTGKQQAPWRALLEKGTFVSPAAPESWMQQKQWLSMLKQATLRQDKQNAAAWLELGMACLARSEQIEAEKFLRISLKLVPSAMAMFGLAEAARQRGKTAARVTWLKKAFAADPTCGALAVFLAQALLEAGKARETLGLIDTLDDKTTALPRIRLYKCRALCESGRPKEALDMLSSLQVPDVREGELSVTALWFDIMRALAQKNGIPFDEKAAVPPAELDFRAALD